MTASWGKNYCITLFGESHGVGIGVVIDGIPPGISIDWEQITHQLRRRRPGHQTNTSSRVEQDEYEILSGVLSDKATGAPLTAFIPSKDQKSRDYDQLKMTPRPGHADYPAFIKYKGFNDYRGGGIFSGRLTAPIVFAGALARQILALHGIVIGGHIFSVGEIKDIPFNHNEENISKLNILSQEYFPVVDKSIGVKMKEQVEVISKKGDSIGGMVECMAIGVPVGLGEPFFRSVESCIAQLAFSIPGVVGIEFGTGMQLAELSGSNANDAWHYQNQQVKAITNHHGGALGGITTGMPVVYRVAFKPTPSIALSQQTVNLHSQENTELIIKGRHDPCIVLRAVPVMEAVLAIALLELLLENQ